MKGEEFLKTSVTDVYVFPGKERIPEDGVFINTSPEFLVGCDCTDGCRDKSVLCLLTFL